jgi:hypothetical protein
MTEIKSIHGHTELAEVPATADEVLVWDASAAAHRRVSRANFLGYTEYVALLTQTSTNAPTAVEIKNDTGATVAWSRTNTGVYRATFSSAVLTANKTVVLIMQNFGYSLFACNWISTTIAAFYTQASTLAVSAQDGYLLATPVIIRIYV